MASPLQVARQVGANVAHSRINHNHQAISRSKSVFLQGTGVALYSAIEKGLVAATLIVMTAASAAVVIHKEVVCSKKGDAFNIVVNSSSHYFSVRAAEVAPPFRCNVTVSSASAIQQSRPRFVKLTGFYPATGGTTCNSLNHVQLKVEERAMNFCKTTILVELLLWINMPFTLEHTFNSTIPLIPYMVSLSEEAEAVNVCDLGKSSYSLQVEHKTYVFATNHQFQNAPPNNIKCTLLEYNVTMEARSPSNILTVTVLAAPLVISCWTPLLNGQRYSNGDTLIAEAGSSVTLHYGICSVQSVDCPSTCYDYEGFTLRIEVAEAQLLSIDNSKRINTISNAEVNAIVAGSVASTVLVSVAATLTGTFLLRRYRRATNAETPIASTPSNRVFQSVAGLVVAPYEEIPMRDNDIYGVAVAK